MRGRLQRGSHPRKARTIAWSRRSREARTIAWSSHPRKARTIAWSRRSREARTIAWSRRSREARTDVLLLPILLGFHGAEGFFGGGYRGGGFRFAVGGGEEGGFKLGGREPDAPIEHGAVEAAERGGV